MLALLLALALASSAAAQSFTVAFTDTNVVYAPQDAWNTVAGASEHVAYTNVSGAAATLLFKGTQVSVAASKKYDRGNMFVYIDGNKVATVSQTISSGTGNIETLWTSTTLGETTHNITIADGAQAGEPQFISFSSFTYQSHSNLSSKISKAVPIATGVAGGVIVTLLIILLWQWRVRRKYRRERTDLDQIRPYQTSTANEVIDASAVLKPSMSMGNASPAERLPLAMYDPRQSFMMRHSSGAISASTSADMYSYIPAYPQSPTDSTSARMQSFPSSQMMTPLLSSSTDAAAAAAGAVGIPYSGSGVSSNMSRDLSGLVPDHIHNERRMTMSPLMGASTSQQAVPVTQENTQHHNSVNVKAVYAIQNAGEGDDQVHEAPPPQYGS